MIQPRQGHIDARLSYVYGCVSRGGRVGELKVC